jgi:prevent-host-death family protein
MYVEVASRELRNDTAGLLRRVEEGERLVITRRGKPVADLIPHREEASWLGPDETLELVTKFSADPGLRADLERFAGDTTDDLGPLR